MRPERAFFCVRGRAEGKCVERKGFGRKRSDEMDARVSADFFRASGNAVEIFLRDGREDGCFCE